jgi:DNA-binding NarL/FixJ family response regulator
MLNILVVEDHTLVREGLLAALASLASDAKVIGAADATEATVVLEQADIDLMLLDLMLPGTKGQTFLPLVRRRFPTVPVLILSALDDADTVARVMKAGAAGFVSKASSSTELIEASRAVLAGDVYLPAALRAAMNRSDASQVAGKPLAQRYGLTPAQARVLDVLVEGGSNRQIAELLGVTEGTVKIHVSAILRALGAGNRAEAALIASRKRR